MKTEDLIAALALEPDFPGPRPCRRRIALWSGAGALVAAAVTLWVMGPRLDLGELAGQASFAGKAGYTLALAVAGFWLLDRLGRPGAQAKPPALALALLLLSGLIATVIELAMTPAAGRLNQLMGGSALICPVAILGLGLLILLPTLWATRVMAPVRPALAGGAVGLLAGGLSATAYGLHCSETAVSFLVVWYGLGVALVGLVGAALGSRLLRW
ncbi:MAG: DUF1109 domain-containing protein [Phenylobacterium sp.]|uniref:DUF1109 domain-containing protein n=1 Tax=Phenylobacterium sp. TaxID=1871053 RepID=UPI0025E2C392|nr:DUF1109 domain-containing protein [Phenylobacterium sp.]MCG9915114.1 DUF1109 domain-containing protein [Phenylobacterium sp.]